MHNHGWVSRHKITEAVRKRTTHVLITHSTVRRVRLLSTAVSVLGHELVICRLFFFLNDTKGCKHLSESVFSRIRTDQSHPVGQLFFPNLSVCLSAARSWLVTRCLSTLYDPNLWSRYWTMLASTCCRVEASRTPKYSTATKHRTELYWTSVHDWWFCIFF